MANAGDWSPDPVGPAAVGPAVVRPGSGVEVAAALRRAADARQSLVIRGGGTKSDWGRTPGRVDAILDMRGLNRVLEHQHGDMTATIEAGATLRDVNRALAQHGQWVPLDPPHADEATIGGILATNDSGPLRHRYGTPRDLVIGVQLATTDGVLSRAGGRVVKNVAGYDLGKLVTGSFGSLAAIVSATFKLSPLPTASTTLQLDVPDAAALAQVVRTVMASQLEPIAFDLAKRRSTQKPQSPQNPPQNSFSPEAASSANSALTVVIRFASLPTVVHAQIEEARARLKACTTYAGILEGDAELSVWREHAQWLWTGDAAIVRASWLPAHIAGIVDELDTLELVGRAAVGAGLIRIDGDADTQACAIERLRASAVLGNIVIVRGSAALKARVDVWGSAGDRQPLFDSLKRALDPHNVLNAGRGPL
jgi:glycolate oxidase FAD binding subunit